MEAINLKSGKKYKVISDNVVECTNDREGNRIVLYTDGSETLYSRDYNEFIDKFKILKAEQSDPKG